MLTESFVEQSLVITAASALDLLSKPRKNVIVDSDGDAGFPASDRNHRATLCIAEIVFTSHGGPHIGFSRAPLPDALKSDAHFSAPGVHNYDDSAKSIPTKSDPALFQIGGRI